VLWNRDSATVREVFDELRERHHMGYTTVLKFMQIMTAKGMIRRDTGVRPQVYRAVDSRQKVQRTLLEDLLDRAFGGSPGDLALEALSMRGTSPEKLRELRSLIERLEESGPS